MQAKALKLLQKKDNRGFNVLFVAVAEGQYSVLSFLDDAPKNVKAEAFKLLQEKDNRGLNVLFVAAANRKYTALRWLLDDAPENVKAI